MNDAEGNKLGQRLHTAWSHVKLETFNLLYSDGTYQESGEADRSGRDEVQGP